jgi:hypothetical protein
MDDKEQNLIEKMVDKISAGFENIALEPEPLKPGEKVVMVTMVSDGL